MKQSILKSSNYICLLCAFYLHLVYLCNVLIDILFLTDIINFSQSHLDHDYFFHIYIYVYILMTHNGKKYSPKGISSQKKNMLAAAQVYDGIVNRRLLTFL